MIVEFENIKRKKTQDFICDILYFGKEKLFPRHKNVFINIKRVYNQGTVGDVFEYDDREFHMRYDGTLSPSEIVTTLLHEMVHVKQYLKGEMPDQFEYKTMKEYYDLPHEKEAYIREEELTEEYYAEQL